MKLIQRLNEMLYKKRELHIDNFFIEIKVQFVLAMPIQIILLILISALLGLLAAQLLCYYRGII